MAYLINNYDGTPLVNVPDRTLDITTSSVKIPGRDYRPYGEIMVENMIHMLQHFAQGVPPLNPISGQLWFDTSLKQMKVYDGATLSWIPVGSPQSGNTFPSSGGSGQVFYHMVKRQLFVWDATGANWRLVGPVGAFDNSEQQTLVPIHSVWDVTQIPEVGSSTLHPVWRLVIAGNLVMIFAQSTFNAGISNFVDPIRPGINLRSNYNMVGVSTRAQVSDNALALDSIPASRFMRVDVNNVPDQTGVRNLGSEDRRFASVHANSFVGNATTATTAVSATTATTAISATNALNLAGEPASYYQNATNLNAGTVAEARLPATVMLKSGSTMTGPLILNGAPTDPLQAATKAYVDQATLRIFETSPFAIANSGVYTFTHGLGGIPRFVTLDLINKTANGDYAPGDIIEVSWGSDPGGSNEGVAVKKNATNITIYVGANGPSEYVRGSGSGAGFILISDRWDMVVRAYR